MSKKGYINRYLLIIKKLEQRPFATFEEIQYSVENQLKDELIGFSKRTFQRDINEIASLFDIEIEFSKSKKGYFINNESLENGNFSRIMESFDVFNSLNYAKGATPYIYLEKRKPQGTEHLYGLIHAIKNKYLVEFTYHKYWENEYFDREVSPLGLKEFRNRWYLIAHEKDNSVLKTFGLDRISDLKITNSISQRLRAQNIDEYFSNCFGISSSEGKEPEEVILAFDSQQGRYVKSLPLHSSQTIIVETEKELQIKLKLIINFDFVMELLSYGAKVKVISPNTLKDKLLETYQKSINLYK